MRMGQLGPRTLPKCRMRGMRFVRKRVSIMTATLLLMVPLKISFALFEGFDLSFPPFGDLAVGDASVPGGGVLEEAWSE